MVPDAPDGWVGLTDAAKHLGRAKQTILHWVHSGKLRSVQVRSGKRRGLRIDTATFTRLVAGCAQATNA
jgi:excisionase family DNA binding protein